MKREIQVEKKFAELQKDIEAEWRQLSTLDVSKADEALQQCSQIAEHISSLENKVEDLEKSANAPKSLVKRSEKIEPEKTAADVTALLNNLRDVKSSAKSRRQLQTLTPQLEALTVSLQSKLDNIDTAPPTSLDEQKLALNVLQTEKLKIQSLLDNIPDIAAAAPIMRSSEFELSRLSELIQRLGDAVGDKMAALTAFLATKSEIESQLEDIGKILEKQAFVPIEEEKIAENLNVLDEQRKKIDKLRQKIESEVTKRSLDDDKRNDLEKLNQSLELMSEKISEAQKVAEDKAAEKIAANEHRKKLALKNDQFVALIDDAQNVLSDTAAVPKSYERLAGVIVTAIEEAQQLSAGHYLSEPLQSSLLKAVDAADKLKKRHTDWLTFVEQKNLANRQLDVARQQLDEVEKKDLRGLEEVQDDLAHLIVCSI